MEGSKCFKMFDSKSRIPNAEATVVQKFNQGTSRQTGCIRLPGSFFVTFLDKQKSKEKNIEENLMNRREFK